MQLTQPFGLVPRPAAGVAVLLFAATTLCSATNIEELAPGIWAAGFNAKNGSANCGFVALADQTLLIDVPRTDAAAFLAEVQKITHKPVRSVVLTDARNRQAAEALSQHGVRLVEPASIPSLQAHPYANGVGIYLPKQKVLFAGPAAINGPPTRLAPSDTAVWIASLKHLQRVDAVKVVPGFGSWGDFGILKRQERFLVELRRQVAYMLSMGRPIEFIEKEVRLPSEFQVWMPYDDPKPEDIRHIYSELTVPAAPFSGRNPGASDALVLIGDRYHEPGHLEDGLRPVFAAAGVTAHFTADIHALTAENLAKVKLLVILRDGMLWPDGPTGKNMIWMTPEQEKAVADFVNGGGAFLNLHNSMGIYPPDGLYLKLVGGRYIGHGPLERFRVEVVDKQHPITRGVRDFFAADEQHTPPYDKDKVHLLLQNRSDDGKVAAAGWAYEPGRGRLCHLAPGHTREALHNPQFQLLMRNAVNWCLRRSTGDTSQEVTDNPKLPRVLIIGDSISMGYTAPVRRSLEGVANVHRIPTNGETTRTGLRELDVWLGTGKWDVIHFNWGLHDLKVMNDGIHQVPLDEYETNLRALVRRLKATGARLVWAATTPVPTGDLHPLRHSADVPEYNKAAQRVMAENGVAIDDLYSFALPKLGEWQIRENVHYTPPGYQALGEKVVENIRRELRRN